MILRMVSYRYHARSDSIRRGGRGGPVAMPWTHRWIFLKIDIGQFIDYFEQGDLPFFFFPFYEVDLDLCVLYILSVL